MARVCLLTYFIVGLMLGVYGLAAEITEENTGAVFVSQQAADTVLRRLRRYNSGHGEEIFVKANLERECIEETCVMEEAREVFEDDDKTMAFWASYSDGDQCKPPPCQNGGQCEDGIGSYVCYCKPNFDGKNCEIEVSKQCLVNNGGCSHFCVMKANIPVCQCAAGYQLGPDKKSCEPTEQFSCGRVNLSSTSVTRSIITPRSSSTTHSSGTKNNSSDTLEDDLDDYLTELYDYYDLPSNESDLANASVASVVKKTISEPTIIAENNTDERIVGGNEAIPGEIPWQIALMYHSDTLQKGVSFCGGSLLSDLWIITAAHCLTHPDYATRVVFVRVGEHDVNKDEGPERDHVIAEQHIHPLYDAKKSPYNNDIALLKLASPVELSNQRRPICLGPKDFTEKLLRDSSSSLVSGWGQLKFQGHDSSKLQKLAVPYVERTICKQSSRDHITRFMFCAGYQTEKKDSCQGDSGGPHSSNYKGTWFLTGIVSWGEECAMDGKYGIYTRVSRYYAWITRTTGISVNN
ncbi:hypothetical protein EPR50_G00139320 [Perca flavescens]|uniref:Coagulation factor IX n=1 Tax=Perca flavescens TaxID=8167 RepID=A0A484CTX7_PERFV|nr:hypothetical protein EPR50_G00139320 [Perca flavescens]